MALALVAMAMTSVRLAAETTASIDAATSELTIRYNTSPLVSVGLVFWRGEWSWMSLQPRATSEPSSLLRTFSLSDTSSRFSIDTEFRATSPTTAAMSFDFSETAGGANDVFGGIVFQFAREGLRADGVDPAPPEILPNGMGWRWQVDPRKPPLVVTFNVPVAQLNFERGNQNEIRAYLLTRNNRRDAGRVQMTISGLDRIEQAPGERLSAVTNAWTPVPLDTWRSPVDLSFLNAPERPAGSRGFVRARGENLEFEDGTRARFWGTNITAYALFGFRNPEQVRLQARRISSLGFNLVRLHHHDSGWVRPNIFGSDQSRSTFVDGNALDRIHWWVKALRDEGVYVWIDLDVGREFTDNDGIEAFEEVARGRPRARMSNFAAVNGTVRERMKDFAEAYLSPINPLTGLALKDDPAVVGVLITNENDLSYHNGNSFLPDKNVPWHSARYMALARDFARQNGLDADRTWRSWEFGPSKLFLADLERRLHVELAEHLRGLGVRVPIVGTNYWGRMGVAGLPSLVAASDIIDVHSYGGADEVRFNPRYRDNIASWIASGAVAGKPVTVSEWNVAPFPVADRFQVPLQIAATASLQGWAGLMQYAYSQERLDGGATPGDWHAYTDPALLATMPAAALMYRQGHVREGATTYYLDLSREHVFYRHTGPDTSRAIRTLAERSRLRIGLPAAKELSWLTATQPPAGARVIRDPSFDAIGAGQNRVCSDTGEICRDWQAGVLTVNTPRSQIASGWIGGREIKLGDVSFALTTPNASVAVQSLDGAPIAEARRVLISMSAQAVPRAGNQLPFVAEPVVGALTIRSPAGMRLSRLTADGKKQLHPIRFENGRYDLSLVARDFSQWWLLESDPN